MLKALLFTAPWHAPSRAFSEVVPLVIRPDILSVINIDESRELAKSLGVSRIPHLLIFSGGVLVWSGVGVHTPRFLTDTLTMLKNGVAESILKGKAVPSRSNF